MPAAAVPAHADVDALAKQTQNPVADLVSMPFQFNFQNGGDLHDQTSLLMNFQPVVPIHLTSRVNLIARPIIPFASVPGANDQRYRGLGDIQGELFFSPAGSSAVVWGIGPIFAFPTATAAPLVTGSWGLGPAGVLAATLGQWVLGGLASQTWNLKDNGGPPKNNLLSVQPFINYNLGAGVAIGTGPIITASWDAARDDTWTLPVGANVSRTFHFGMQPLQMSVHYYRNVVRPDGAPANLIRVVVNLLFPTRAPHSPH